MNAPTKSSVEMKSVLAADDGLRLDRWFKAHYPALRHGALEKMLRKGQIRVDGTRVKANYRVSTGEEIRVPPMPLDEKKPARQRVEKSATARKADREFLTSITVFEDEAILVLNKPFGLAVQGGTNTKKHIDGMLGALEKNGERPRLVHRLDRDTGGVLIVAKTRKSAAALSEAMRRHQVEKTYWALTAGSPRPKEGTINLPIAKKVLSRSGGSQSDISDEGAIERMAADKSDDAKKAITDFMTIEDAGTVAFLALKPVTGRTHQLRVHTAAIETPIVGDFKYGGENAYVEGVAKKMHLFCRTMRLPHPVTGKLMAFSAPLHGHMKETWKFFGFQEPAEIDWPDLKGKK